MATSLSSNHLPFHALLEDPAKSTKNSTAETLLAIAERKGEGSIASNGAFAAFTGAHTGRSPKDKFIFVDDETRSLAHLFGMTSGTPKIIRRQKHNRETHRRVILKLLYDCQPLVRLFVEDDYVQTECSQKLGNILFWLLGTAMHKKNPSALVLHLWSR